MISHITATEITRCRREVEAQSGPKLEEWLGIHAFPFVWWWLHSGIDQTKIKEPDAWCMVRRTEWGENVERERSDRLCVWILGSVAQGLPGEVSCFSPPRTLLSFIWH